MQLSSSISSAQDPAAAGESKRAFEAGVGAPLPFWRNVLNLGIDPRELADATRHQINVLTATTLLFLVVAAVVAVQAYTMGFSWELILLGASSVVGIANLELLRRLRRPVVSGHISIATLYVLIGTAAWTAGGFYHPSFAWTYIVPLAAAVVVDLRGALVWTAATVALGAGYWGVHEIGIDLALPLGDPAQRASALVDRVMTVTAVSILGLCFGVTYRKGQVRLAEEKRYLQLTVSGAIAANQAPSLSEAMARAAERICGVLHWEQARVIDIGRDGSQQVVHRVAPDPGPAPALLEDATSRVLARALESGEAQLEIVDSEQHRRWLRARRGARLVVAVPVRSRDRVCAAIVFVGTPHSIDFELDRLRKVFTHVAAQLGQVAVRTELQSHLRQQQKMAAVGKLAAGMAHEINNPMSFVRTNLHALQDSLGKAATPTDLDLPEWQEAVEESLEGVERAVTIVRDVVAFSREGGVDPTSWEATPLDPLVSDSVRVCSADSRDGTTIDLECGSDAEVACAPNAIRQVCVNLILNAVHAAGPQGSVTVTTAANADEGIIVVEDDGPGVPPASRERIFEPFFTTKEVGLGTGLGLSVSFEIVASHRGEIRVDDSERGGARFEVRLPRA